MPGNAIILKISIDCNFNQHGFSKPTISPFEIEYFSLKEGDIVNIPVTISSMSNNSKIFYKQNGKIEKILQCKLNCKK